MYDLLTNIASYKMCGAVLYGLSGKLGSYESVMNSVASGKSNKKRNKINQEDVDVYTLDGTKLVEEEDEETSGGGFFPI